MSFILVATACWVAWILVRFQKELWQYALLCFPVADVLHVQEPWYTEIVNGRKTIEGRPGNKTKFLHLLGKTVRMTNGKHSVLRIIYGIQSFIDLESYLEYDWEKKAPHVSSREDALQAYKDIKYPGHLKQDKLVFSEENIEEKGGICALFLRPYNL